MNQVKELVKTVALKQLVQVLDGMMEIAFGTIWDTLIQFTPFVKLKQVIKYIV